MNLKFDKQFIKYLFLPKGLSSIFFKLYIYLIPFIYILTLLGDNSIKIWLIFAFLFILFEFCINPVRYQINDLFDIKGDKLRENHWNRPIDENNKNIVIILIIVRLFIFIPLTFYIDNSLGILSISFVLLQLMYDVFAKIKFYSLSFLMATIAYPLRSLVIFVGFDFVLDQNSYLILLFIFVYSTYMLLQWRIKESIFITYNELHLKPGTIFFNKPIIKNILDSTFLLVLVVSIFIFSQILNLGQYQQFVFYSIAIVSTVLFLLFSRVILENILKQIHNVIIVVFFLIVFGNITMLQFLIPILIPLILSWYHRIYINKFSEKYFTKKHYE